MIEARIPPGIGVVTLRTLPAVVVALAVTGETVGFPVVAEVCVMPIVRVVAVRTPG